MAYQPKDMTGSLFKNDRREKDTHPQAKGTALIGGVEYWVSAWTREKDNGEKWQSLSFTPKQQTAAPAPAKTHAQMKRGETLQEMDDDIPW